MNGKLDVIDFRQDDINPFLTIIVLNESKKQICQIEISNELNQNKFKKAIKDWDADFRKNLTSLEN